MRAESSASFERYVREHWARLHRIAFLVCGDRARAEEVLQGALVKLCASWSRVQRADNPDGYVRRVIVNAAIDHAAVVSRHSRDIAHKAAAHRLDGTVSEANEIAARIDLRAYLLQLPPRQRAVVVLRYLEDLSERETALALGLSVGTVKSHTSRALGALRRQLTEVEAYARFAPDPSPVPPSLSLRRRTS